MKKQRANNSKKCDVIIPVYNAPEWVKLCVYALMINTPKEYLGKVYLIDDKSNANTVDCLNNLKKKYKEHIEIIKNHENLGFVKTSNKGMKLSDSKYVLLLNSDCLISKNTIPKLISHIDANSKIGLISPLANNAANLTLKMYDGFSYTQMDALLEKKFPKMNFDACTIVGNCLMITRKCIDEVGYFDEAYGMGYGEETDYHFRALSKGFEAKVAIDTYVFHKAEASFGTSEAKNERIARNRDLFFSRWGGQYDIAAKKYDKNDPIKFIEENVTDEDKQIVADTLFYLPFITQSAGGCHTVFDMVNHLVINGLSANILYDIFFDYQEVTLFEPILKSDNKDIKIKQIVATIWWSTYLAQEIAKEKNVPVINYVQGYENYFENGRHYNSVGLTHKIADYELTISHYLQDKIKKLYGKDSTVISNGVNYDLMYHKNPRKKAKAITFVLRNNSMKGDYILVDIIRQIDNEFAGLEINVVYMDKEIEIPFVNNNKLRKVLGPVSRLQIVELLKNTDIYVDASVNEGFGLIGLEAMTCGAVPIVSNSFGVLEYMRDGENGFVVDEVNNSDKYIEKISMVINDEKIFSKLKKNGNKLCKKFDYDLTVEEYIKYFSTKRSVLNSAQDYTKEELKLIRKRTKKTKEVKPTGLTLARALRDYIPFPVRKLMKKVITNLYHLFDHS